MGFNLKFNTFFMNNPTVKLIHFPTCSVSLLDHVVHRIVHAKNEDKQKSFLNFLVSSDKKSSPVLLGQHRIVMTNNRLFLKDQVEREKIHLTSLNFSSTYNSFLC